MKRAGGIAVLAAIAALAVLLLTRRAATGDAASPCHACKEPSLPPHPPPVSEEGYERLGPPAPGEWRDKFQESPQSFEEYAVSSPNRKCPHRTTFYLQPLTAPPGRRSHMQGAA